MKQLFTIGITCLALSAHGQLVVQNGATFFIDAGATVTVQGDVTTNTNITGTGKLLMKGSALQTLSLNGFSVPVLEIDNASHVSMGSAGRVTDQLIMTTGKLQLGNFNLTLNATSTVTGAGAGRFVETNGTGELRRELTAAGTYTLPVGVGNDFTPVTYNVSGGSYSSAFLGARAVAGSHPAKHPRSTDYLNVYWMLNRSGISGATINTVGTYADPSSVTGVEADLRSMTFDGTNWTLGTGLDAAANTVTAPMTGSSSQLYAMNRFVLVTPSVMLQGAFDPATGLMHDRLRSIDATQTPGTPSASNIIPTNDPYRTPEYSSQFVHVNNPVAEVAAPSVFYHKANPAEHIVDWVFVELRTRTNDNAAAVIQTRSAFVRRDGRIVDIDGTSPVYFKNVDAGTNYVIAVRHRNHAGIASKPASPLSLGLSNTNFDFTNTANTGIYGTAGSAYTQLGNPLKNVLWGGEVSGNNTIRYQGSNGPGPTNMNDRASLLAQLGNVETNLLGTYTRGDLNMNRVARYQGSNGVGPTNQNDRAWLLSQVLENNETTIRTQVLPTNL
jgi:hypothetical protein